MHWVSWDRTDRDAPRLLAEAGPEVLAEFTHDSALVDGVRWDLAATPVSGAVARVDGVELVRSGAWKSSREVPVVVDGREYLMVNEDGSDWIINNAAGEKVAQFSGKNHGVRVANVEFEGETDLPLVDVVALAWVARLTLENKTMGSSKALIATLVLLSIVVVLVFFS